MLRYASEARIVWNVPLQHEATSYLTECLNHYFGGASKWRFWSIDKRRRMLTVVVSLVVDMQLKEKSKLSFMKA